MCTISRNFLVSPWRKSELVRKRGRRRIRVVFGDEQILNGFQWLIDFGQVVPNAHQDMTVVDLIRSQKDCVNELTGLLSHGIWLIIV